MLSCLGHCLRTVGNYLDAPPPPSLPQVNLDQFFHAAQKERKRDRFVLIGERIVALRKSATESEETKELNRSTWTAFEEAMRHAFTNPRFENTCARYDLDFTLMRERGLPLERRHIEAAGIAASTPYIYQIGELLDRGGRDIRKLSSSEIGKLVDRVTKNGYLGENLADPEKLSGGSEDETEILHQSYQLMDQRRNRLSFDVADLVSDDPNIGWNHPFLQRLTMATLSLLETKKADRDVGIIIPAPSAIKGETDYYQVYDIISDGGLTAIALSPLSDESSLSPILAFRGTKGSLSQAETMESLLNDVENNIGELGYRKSKRALDCLMGDPEFLHGKKPIVTAFSLGGAHATYFMRDHWREIEECVCFNWAGNNVAVDPLAEEINAIAENQSPPPIYLYRNFGDYVNGAGKKHLGYGITHPRSIVQLIEFDVDDIPTPHQENVFQRGEVNKWLNLHGIRPLDSNRKYNYAIYRGKECNSVLDTYSRKKEIEDQRNQLFKVFNAIYQTLDFIFRLFGLEFFKKNL